MKRFVISIISAIVPLSVVLAQSPSGHIDGHDYVDLGLSVKWATCNVGAGTPSDYGDYYAWGETVTKMIYSKNNCKTYGKRIADVAANPHYDVVRAAWGGKWRMPTNAEMQELIDNCTWTWTTDGDRVGYMVTGSNGNSIFLPAAGWRDGKSLEYPGQFGCYWCSSPLDDDAKSSYNLYFASYSHISVSSYRLNGYTIRPVTE
ncbi:MAG: hypothetical protein ACI306_06815 [Muribaculaceae bacterium]